MNFFQKLFSRGKPEDPIYVRRAFQVSGGSLVSSDTCMEVSAFYRGVIFLSTQIAKLPFNIKDRDNTIINNDLSYLLNTSPNYEMTSFHFKLFMIQCALINGNGYAEIERTGDGRVVALWPLNDRKVCPYRAPDGTLFYEVIQGGKNGENVYIPPRNMFVLRNFHMKDAISGQGVVAYATTTLGISLGGDKFANSLFANGGLTSGVITVKGRIDEEAYVRLKEDWLANQGGKKTGGVAILEDGTTYSPISHSPDVLQFLESRKFNVLEIARYLGVPPTKLFDSEAAKYNNIEHANLEIITDTLDAWAINWESEVDFKLLSGNKAGRFSEMDLYSLYRGDMSARATYFQKMMQSGAITPNEIRKAEGHSPYQGGDRYYIATNNFTPADKMDELLDSQIKKNLASAEKDEAASEMGEKDNETPEENEEISPVDMALVRFLEAKTK